MLLSPLTICPECEYSLRGLPPDHACPECGLTFSATDQVIYVRQYWFMTAIFAFLVAVLVSTSYAFIVDPQLYSGGVGPWPRDNTLARLILGFYIVFLICLVVMANNSRRRLNYLLLNDRGIIWTIGHSEVRKIPWELMSAVELGIWVPDPDYTSRSERRKRHHEIKIRVVGEGTVAVPGTYCSNEEHVTELFEEIHKRWSSHHG